MGKSAASHRELFEMLEAQEYKCNLTGEQLTCSKEEGDNSVCDHIVPVCRDGSSTIENLQWITKDINKAKGQMTNEEFVEMCRKVVNWADGGLTSGGGDCSPKVLYERLAR